MTNETTNPTKAVMRSNHDIEPETMTATPQRTTAPATNGDDTPPMATSAIILLFVGLMIAMFMFSLNQTVLATALPTKVVEHDRGDNMRWGSNAIKQ